MAKQIIEVKNRTIAQVLDEDGIINAVKGLKCNNRLSFVDELAIIGKNCKVFNFVNIYGPVKIGEGTLISSFVSIQGEGTSIGSNCRIGDFTFIPAWTVIEDNVFIGQNCSLTNDKYPKSHNKDWKKQPVIVRKGASIGSGSVILPGVEIGELSIIGAGSVVTKSVPTREMWYGNPATFRKKV